MTDPDTTDHPYSPAFDAGDLVFVSGALCVTVDDHVVTGRADAVAASLATLERRLRTVGLGLEHVCSTTYYVTDISLREEANEHFARAFKEPRPARTFVEVTALPYGCTVEISGIASKRAQRAL